MKKSDTSFSFSALALLLAGFLFTSANVAFAADDKPADTKEVATEKADAEGTDADKMKKKKKKDGEEPECE